MTDTSYCKDCGKPQTMKGCDCVSTELDDMNAEIKAARPQWIEPVEVADIAAIQQGGCASGAYMPAVTYHDARVMMSAHGDDVLQYIEDGIGELPQVPDGTSWSGMAVFYLSVAVELWAGQFDIDNLEY